MKRIEEYIEKIYRNFDEKDEETKIIKEETKVHLLEEVADLKKQGLTEEESINKAISNFGSEKVVISEMNLILKKQNKFSKALKKVTLITFIVACLFFSIDIGDEFINRDENNFKYDKNTTSYVIETIRNKIQDKDSLDESLKNEITQLLDEFNKQNNNGLYYIRLEYEPNSSIEYEYKKDVSEDMINGGHGGLSRRNNWSIHTNTTEDQANYDYKKHKESWDKVVNRLPNRLGQVSNYLFVVSAVLLCVYIINKVYLKSSFLNK
ncbi:hypothetical protein UT300007_35240 [Clostridium sp. CTA-7]|jgi:hypothetical protein